MSVRPDRRSRCHIAWLAALAFSACGGAEGPGGSVDAGTAGTDAGPAALGSDDIFDDGRVQTFEFLVDPADWEWLQANGRDEQYVPATLVYEGRQYPGAGLRYKGSYGALYFQGPVDDFRPCFDQAGGRLRDNCPKLSMKASFNAYDDELRFAGLKKLQFHAMANDPTMMVERLGYGLFDRMDVFAPRTGYARLLVNGELQGLYILIEQIDGRFTRERFPDGGEGNLYKEVWPVHGAEQPYLDALKSNRDENPSAAKMVRFVADLAAADDASFVQVLERWTDVDMLMRKMAVDRAIEHWDGVVAWYCSGAGCSNHNYYWYESTDDDFVWLIPWDLDRAMVWPPPVRTLYGMPDWDEPAQCTPIPVFFGITGMPPHCDELIGRMARILWNRYVAATEQLLAGPFQMSELLAAVDAAEALIADHVEQDPHIDADAWRAAVAQFRLDLAALRASIEAKIQE